MNVHTSLHLQILQLLRLAALTYWKITYAAKENKSKQKASIARFFAAHLWTFVFV